MLVFCSATVFSAAVVDVTAAAAFAAAGSLKRGRSSDDQAGVQPGSSSPTAAEQVDVKMEGAGVSDDGGPSKQLKLEDGSASPSHTGTGLGEGGSASKVASRQ